MNVREMLVEIPKRWPSALVRSDWGEGPFDYTLVTLENNWRVGFGYGDSNYCSRRWCLSPEIDPMDVTEVEVAIWRPSGEWYLSENMDACTETKTGYLPWQTSEQVFAILDYISRMEGGR
jgi:hypothetical protein